MDVDLVSFGHHVEESAVIMDDGQTRITPEKPVQN
jgi:hypothetical protein